MINKIKKQLDIDIKLTWKWSEYIVNNYLNKYNFDSNKVECRDEKNSKIVAEIPIFVDDKNKYKISEVSENVCLDYLIDITKIDLLKSQKLGISHDNIKKLFFVLMSKEDIVLQWRESIKILVDNKLWKYKYYKIRQKLAWEPIWIEEDMELYKVVDRVVSIINQRLDIVSKIENIELLYIDKSKQEKLEVMKTLIAHENKLLFMDWGTNDITQEIILSSQESIIISYKLKKNLEYSINVKDSKATKSQWVWFIKKKLNSKLEIKEYKIIFEPSDIFKLKFYVIE